MTENTSPYDWFRWCVDVQVDNPATKVVLYGLIRHVDGDGVCWVSHARLARYSCCSIRTVGRSLSRLESLGIVQREKRKGRTDILRIVRTPVRKSEGYDRESEGYDSLSDPTQSPRVTTQSPRVKTESRNTPVRESDEESKEETTEESTEETNYVETDLGRVWTHYREAWKRIHGTSLNRTHPKRCGLATVLRTHGLESTLRLVDWWETSEDSRASFLREKKVGHRTLFKPEKASEYVSSWVEPWWNGRTTAFSVDSTSTKPTAIITSKEPGFLRRLRGYQSGTTIDVE